MNRHTLEQIAKSYSLWGDYVDTMNLDSEEEFENKSLEEKINLMISCGFSDTKDK
jgi:hypothetical protein